MAATQGNEVRREPGSARVVVDGLVTDVRVDHHVVDEAVLPELARLAERRRPGRRSFVFLVAPPGAGKSTLAALLRQRAGNHLDLDAVGIDGFHRPNDYLASHHVDRDGQRLTLSSIKGAPETFDLAALARQLARAGTEDLPWPRYDRRVHEAVPGRDPVTAGLVVVEGNWLLLDEPGWDELATHSAYNIFIDADPTLLRDRLIGRKIRGGLSPDAAREFYERSDRLNVDRVLDHTDRAKVDLLLSLTADGTLHRKATP